MPEYLICPKCGSRMKRCYVKDWSDVGRGKQIPVGWYCPNCGTSISDVEAKKLGLII